MHDMTFSDFIDGRVAAVAVLSLSQVVEVAITGLNKALDILNLCTL